MQPPFETPADSQDCAELCRWSAGAALACALAVLAFVTATPNTAQGESESEDEATTAAANALPATQHGKASYYADRFAGRKMANGEPMDPESNNAASRTLPLGTKALVKNLENGESALVEIKDRGPYVAGRIIDLAPSTAEQLDMKEQGVVPVQVTPLEVPPGARRAARETTRR